MSGTHSNLHGAGLGLRRVFLQDFVAQPPQNTSFFEVAQENWIHMGGQFASLLEQAAEQMPTERIAYGHVAGHFKEHDTLLIDTHGSDVISPVWELLAKTYEIHGVFPTLLESDFNIPGLPQLEKEVQQIVATQKDAGERNSLQPRIKIVS